MHVVESLGNLLRMCEMWSLAMKNRAFWHGNKCLHSYSTVRAWRNRKVCATSCRCAFGLIKVNIKEITKARVFGTETKMSSFWRNFNHWLHWKLSFWQLPVQPVMKISSKWRHFRFSALYAEKWSVDLLIKGKWHGNRFHLIASSCQTLSYVINVGDYST